MSSDDNKRLVRTFADCINARQLEEALALLGGDYVEHWAETNQLSLLQQLGLVPPPSGY